MVRETRHLWVGNLPQNIPEDRIKEHFKRFGRVQSVKLLSSSKSTFDGSSENCESATVAFMDITSACKAHNVEHSLDDRVLRTDFYDPSLVQQLGETGPGPGGGGGGAGGAASPSLQGRLHGSSDLDTYESRVSSHGYSGSTSSNPSGSSSGSYYRGRYEDPYRGQSQSSRASGGSLGGRGPTAGYRSSTSYPAGSDSRNSSYRSSGGGGASWSDSPSYSSGGGSRIVANPASSQQAGGDPTYPQYLKDPVAVVAGSSPSSVGSGGSGGNSRGMNGHVRGYHNSGGSGNSSHHHPQSLRGDQRSKLSSVGNNSATAHHHHHRRPASSATTASSQSRTMPVATASVAATGGEPVSASSDSGSDSSSDGGEVSSDSPGSNSSRSSSASSSRSSSRRRRRAAAKQPSRKGLAKPVEDADRTNCAIFVRNLPTRQSDLALQESLYAEYKKLFPSTQSVRLCPSGRSGRFAVIYFGVMADALKAADDRLLTTTSPNLMGAEAHLFLAEDDIVDDNKRLFFRPGDCELDEFYPKASRLLHVSQLAREVTVADLQEKFEKCGEIIEVDLKKSGGSAVLQFVDVCSVVKAIRSFDGEAFVGGAKLKLSFGRPVPTKCVWCKGIAAAEAVTEAMLHAEFGRFGKIQDLLVDRARGHALIYFDQTLKAQRAVLEMRGRCLKGSRLQTDYASHECRANFFEQCKKSGLDVRERTRATTCSSVEQQPEDQQQQSRLEGGARSNSDDFDDPKRYAPSTPNSTYHRSPTPTGAASAAAAGNSNRAFHRSNFDPIESPRYMSPTPHSLYDGHGDLRDSLNRNKEHRNRLYHDNGSSNSRYRYKNNDFGPASPASSGDEKDKSKKGAADSGLSSEDHGSTGSAVSTDDQPGYRKHMRGLTVKIGSGGDYESGKIRRPSSDSARSSHLDDPLSSELNSPPPREIPLYPKQQSRLKSDGEEDVSSRPGTPLCDERPDNHLTTSEGPVRLLAHLRAPNSEPMSLPLPGFAKQVLSPLLPKTTSKKQDRDPRLKSPGLKSPPPAAATTLKSPLPAPLPPPPTSAPPQSSQRHHVFPLQMPSSIVSDSSRPVDPRLAGLLQVAARNNSTTPTEHKPVLPTNDLETSDKDVSVTAAAATAADPATLSLEERLKALDEKYEKWSGSTKQTSVAATPTPVVGSSPVICGGGNTPNSASVQTTLKLNFDLKPSQPSEIVQKLLARRSVFDEDSKRLESSSQDAAASKTLLDQDQEQLSSLSVGSVNFGGGGYNSISTLSDKTSPLLPNLIRSSLPADPLLTPKSTFMSKYTPPSTIPTPINSNSLAAAVALENKLAVVTSATSVLTSTITTNNLASKEVMVLPLETTSVVASMDKTRGSVVTVATTTAEAKVSTVITSAAVKPPLLASNSSRTVSATSAILSAPTTVVPSSKSLTSVSSHRPLLSAKVEPTKPGEPLAAKKPAAVGQVKPLSHHSSQQQPRSAPLPSIVGASTTTTPIKPLVDNKQRLVSTKPSATVTPTIKSTDAGPTTARRTTLSTTRTVTTVTSKSVTAATVEKGEASSTTSSPKTETLLQLPATVVTAVASAAGPSSPVTAAKEEVKVASAAAAIIIPESVVPGVEQVSPVSSTHPDTCGALTVSPTGGDEDGGVSSTTRELDAKNNHILMRDPLKTLKKELEPFATTKKELLKPMDKFDKVNELFAPTTILLHSAVKTGSKHESKLKENKKVDSVKRTKDNNSSSHHHHRHHHKDKKSSHRSEVQKKLKEKQDKDLQGFLQATDTIPTHLKKDLKRETSRKDSEGSESRSKDKDRKKEKETVKRRLSSHGGGSDESKPAKIAKVRHESEADQPESKKAKLSGDSASATSAPELKMGRIPKIKKEAFDELTKVKNSSGDAKKEKTDDISKKIKSSKDDSRSSKSHHHHSSNSRDKDGKKLHSSSSSKSKDRSSSSSKKEQQRKERRSYFSSDDDTVSNSGKKRENSSSKPRKDKESSSKRREERHSGSSSSKKPFLDGSIMQHQKKKSSAAESESDSSDNSGSGSNKDKQYSIFDDPVIDLDNPVYFSMYDKVKARRGGGKKPTLEDIQRQQAALLAKFKNNKKGSDGKKLHSSGGSSDSDEEEESEEAKDRKVQKLKNKRLLSSSSEDERDEEEAAAAAEKRRQQKKKMVKKSRSSVSGKLSDSDEENFTRKKSASISSMDTDSEDDLTVNKSKTNRKSKSSIPSSKQPAFTSSDEDDARSKKPEMPPSKKSNSSRKETNKVSKASDTDSEEDSEPVKKKAAATAVLLQKKKKLPQSKAVSSASDSDMKLQLSSDSDAHHNKEKKKTTVVISSKHRDKSSENRDKRKQQHSSNSVAAKKSKSNSSSSNSSSKKYDRQQSSKKEKVGKTETDKRIMSTIFGSSSEDDGGGNDADEEEVVNKNKPLPKADNVAAAAAAAVKQQQQKDLKIKEEAPALLSDSDCDNRPSRPPTPSLPEVKVETKAKIPPKEESTKIRHCSSGSKDEESHKKKRKKEKKDKHRRSSSSSHSEGGSGNNRAVAAAKEITSESVFDQLHIKVDHNPETISNVAKSSPRTMMMSPKAKTSMASPIAAAAKILSPRNSLSYSAFVSGIKKEVTDSQQSEVKSAAESNVKLEELEKSIASITGGSETVVKEEDISTASTDSSATVAKEDLSKRAVISQEETAQAVTALLGESFDNDFNSKATTSATAAPQTEDEMESETQSAVACIQESEEAAMAVAGLTGDLETTQQQQVEEQQQQQQQFNVPPSPEKTVKMDVVSSPPQLEQAKPAEKVKVESPKAVAEEEEETIGNIEAAIRRSFEADRSPLPPPAAVSEAAVAKKDSSAAESEEEAEIKKQQQQPVRGGGRGRGRGRGRPRNTPSSEKTEGKIEVVGRGRPRRQKRGGCGRRRSRDFQSPWWRKRQRSRRSSSSSGSSSRRHRGSR